MYKYVIRPILFKIDPELVHNLFIFIGRALGSFKITRVITGFFYEYKGNDISRVVDGIYYKTPVILSAGFDYNGNLTEILPSVSFGGEEIGSVTARVCSGNPKPRLKRLPNTKAILVNKGLRNDGVDALIRKIKDKKRIDDFVIGISIARTNDNFNKDLNESVNDYHYSLLKLVENNVGDYYTINISCPNSFSGEIFLDKDNLRILLHRLSSVKTEKPVYIKMPISIDWEKFKGLIDISLEFNFVKGFVIGNLNKDYGEIKEGDKVPESYCGGISGKPCFEKSNYFIKKTREYIGNDKTIIGVGGIFSPKDAKEKFACGADLVSLITGMIYEGPSLIKEISKSLEQK